MEPGKELSDMAKANPEALIDGLGQLPLGLKLRAIRRLLGMSQDDMAQRLGISKQYLSTVERGEQKSVLNVLARMKHLFGASIDALYESAEYKQKG